RKASSPLRPRARKCKASGGADDQAAEEDEQPCGAVRAEPPERVIAIGGRQSGNLPGEMERRRQQRGEREPLGPDLVDRQAPKQQGERVAGGNAGARVPAERARR